MGINWKDIKWKIQGLAKMMGYSVSKFPVIDSIIDNDKNFLLIYSKCKEHTMTSREKMYSLYQAVRYIIKANIPGDFVECGVGSGGSTMLMAYALLELGIKNRKIYLYDTFEGTTEPTEIDNYRFAYKWKEDLSDGHSTWGYFPLEEVKENMEKTGYFKNDLVYIKGKVEDTIPKQMPLGVALLRLDTSWYEPSKHELIHLFPLLSKSGVLIIDDYGLTDVGQKKAVDEYFSDKQSILLNRIDEYGVIGIKT